MEVKEIHKKIQEMFPDEEVKEEHSGWCSWAFSVNTKIIRIAKTDIDGYKKESDLLAFLKDYISVEIPQTKVCEGDFPYIVHEKIIGKEWSLGTYNSLSQKDKDLFCKDVAVFFSELHGISIEEIQKKFPYIKDTSAGYYDINTIAKVLRNEFSSSEMNKIGDKIKIIQDSGYTPVLIHRDFHGENSLVNDNHRLTGVFDFMNATICDRHCEFLSSYYEDHMDMTRKIADIYEDITSVKIDFDRVKTLKIIDDIGALIYLEKNPKIKEEKLRHFKEKTSRIHEELL